MKKNVLKYSLLKKLSGVCFLTLFCITPASAQSTPPLSIVAAETVQNMQINTRQVITYTIKNNVPTAPVMLNMSPAKTMLTPASPLTSWEITNDCTYNGMANYVAPNGQCNVNVAITALSIAGHVQQNLIINYGPTFQTIAPAPLLTFDVTSGGGGGGLLFTVQPTGQNMLTNSTQALIWTIQNTSASPISINNAGINFTVASPLIAAPTFTNNCSNSVPASGTCNIETTIESLDTAGHVSQYLAIPYGTSSTLVADSPTNFDITVSPVATRSITYVNKCPYTVWIGINGGGQGSLGGCTTDAQCNAAAGTVDGFVCNPAANAGNGLCFWKNPVPPGGDYSLTPLTGTKTLVIPEHLYAPTPTQPIVWNGNTAGRAGCGSSGNCAIAACGSGDGACNLGQGFDQPATQSEFTFQQTSDYYNLSVINGAGVPQSFEPLTTYRVPSDPYKCTAPGITANQTVGSQTLGGCSWTYAIPSSSYVWVANPVGAPVNCTASNQCNQAGGEACGLSRQSILANSAQTTCGTFLGYWTGDQICGTENGSYSQPPYNCTTPVTGGTYTNMFLCDGSGVLINSCYSTSGTGCCGCQNWQDAPTNLLVPSSINQCVGSNPEWITGVLPTLGWYKGACPTSYVYPYDDVSSSFTCNNASGTDNHTNYRITYCPDGNTGAPTGTIPNP